ncbi:fungal-specific transcription factor domain-containing protein [Chaetomium strumarium]|uniref:Fungal-specific transcription factor domain-containing protein n=1 Tax=Chaetomium strumarium TaxID=1170767 RepID=A0AAJ0M2H4_9PEZI|nr:fungal-specific transcription factor domain-containing protein [Chaetomium strumarium]
MAVQQPPPEPPPPPSPPRAPVPEPAAMKLTRGHSCVLCQQRKVRCDKQKPCANCVKAQVECRVIPPQPPRRRKKKPHERDLIERLRKYESLLSQHGVNFEPIAHDLKVSDRVDDVEDLEHDLTGLKTSPSSSADHVSPGQGHYKQKWAPMMREYRGPDDDSSDEDYEGPTLHHAYDTMFENSDGFPFVVGGSPASVTNAHPAGIQILQLWQIYISNVNPLLKVTHAPTLQAQIISASANPARIPKPLEALMFSIYFAAITSLTEEEVQSTFSEDRAILLGKFHNATQQALVNAGFMRSSELMVLQAFFLYLLCARPYVDPRSMFGLLGLAFRIATRLGLHRDGTHSGLSPFEAEQRRRLWWQIVIFDKRIAEITGSTVNALSSCACDTRLPLNINDSDLNPHAKGQPGSYAGPTEMLFSLTRIELTIAASSDNVRRSITTPGGRPLHKPMVHYSPSPASPDVVSHVANESLPENLVAFCSHMENTYLKHCDPKIPLHNFTVLMTRQALCKLRIIDFLCRTANADNVDQNERDAYFMEALRMVEYDNIIQSSAMLQCFRWYTYAHFPLPAYLCLVSELRHRTTGELCEHAWNVMIENHERRGLLRRHNRNPLHIAFGRYFEYLGQAETGPSSSSSSSPQALNAAAMVGASGGQQVPVQATLPPIQGSAAGMPAVGDMSAGSANMSAGIYASKPMPPQHTTAPHMGSVSAANSMMTDDAMTYPGYDSMGHVFSNAGGMQDADMAAMDWNYLVQLSSMGAFNPTSGYYVQGTGA